MFPREALTSVQSEPQEACICAASAVPETRQNAVGVGVGGKRSVWRSRILSHTMGPGIDFGPAIY